MNRVFNRSGKFGTAFILLSLSLSFCSISVKAQPTDDVTFTFKKVDQNLNVTAIVPENVKRVEVRVHSRRNQVIGRFSDVSDRDPTVGTEIRPLAHREIWYPVVDIARTPGLEGVILFDKGAEGNIEINGPFIKRKEQVKSQIIVPTADLVTWENTVVVDPLESLISDFYLRMPVPVVMNKARHQFTLLSDNWSGRLELYDITNGRNRQLASVAVEVNDPNKGSKMSAAHHPLKIKSALADGIDRDRLQTALEATIEFTLNSQVDDPGNPAHGGLYLFYDLDSGTYRNSYWMWGWGPSVRFLIDASKRDITNRKPQILQKAAEEIGRKSLEFKFLKENHVLDQVPVGRWSQRTRGDGDVYSPAITIADLQFLSGWAWIPLYELTGDDLFLRTAENLSRATEELMDGQFPVIIPHSYLPESDIWYDYTLNETGFGVEGLAEIYRVTKDQRHLETGRKFMKQHQDVFQRDDGYWDRSYNLSSKRTAPTVKLARGLGWAMEGILAAHRLDPEGGYLEHAERMATQMIQSQYPEGYWTFFTDVPAEERGISEKGTALWSYLLYQLYSFTGDEKYLNSARMALIWCMNNQYLGPDKEAYGSLPGVTQHAAVGYRRFFEVSCAYTSGFFGLALLEELKL